MLYRADSAEPELMFGPVAVASMAELGERLANLARHNPAWRSRCGPTGGYATAT